MYFGYVLLGLAVVIVIIVDMSDIPQEAKQKKDNNVVKTEIKPNKNYLEKIEGKQTFNLSHYNLEKQYQYIQSISKEAGLNVTKIKQKIYRDIKENLDEKKEKYQIFNFFNIFSETISALQSCLQHQKNLNECYKAFCKYLYVKYEIIVLVFRLYDVKFKNDLEIKIFENYRVNPIESFQEDTLNSIYAKVYNVLPNFCKATHITIPFEDEGAEEIDRIYQALTKATFLVKTAFIKEQLSEEQMEKLYKICEDVLNTN